MFPKNGTVCVGGEERGALAGWHPATGRMNPARLGLLPWQSLEYFPTHKKNRQYQDHRKLHSFGMTGRYIQLCNGCNNSYNKYVP